MTADRPYILITNDDGIAAKGIQFLIAALAPVADLLVVAPDGPRSGFGMSITSAHPFVVRLQKETPELTIYTCSGTPVDCVKSALDRYVKRRPDLVVSGINHGDNSSVNSHYSGTMGAAMEASLQGIPSVAFSLDDMSHQASFEPLRPYLPRLTQKALQMNMPLFTCLNINFPATKQFKGIKVCRMAKSRWEHELTDCSNGYRSGDWYWLVGHATELEPEMTDTDRWALHNGYIAITPTTLDNTAYALREQMTDWESTENP